MLMQRLTTNRPKQGKVASFLREESGVMAPHMLIFFFIMLLVGGLAVDLMRFETRRVELQNTMDRATLAAASLENLLVPQDVVRSYFEAAGLLENLDGVTVTEAMNSRTVSATATVRSDNYFMSMMDTPYLEALNTSEAEQRVSNVEIAMVLDVSGSMQNTPSRIANLKIAAKDFIDTVLDQDTDNKISISIVPYNGQVNLGPNLFSKFTVTQTHGTPNSYCIDLPTSTYSSTSVSRSTPFPQTPHVDSWSSTSTSNSYSTLAGPTYSNGLYSNMWCQPNAANYVVVHGNNRNQLKNAIGGLVAVGATSIDLGMKWGSMLLDPSSQSIVSELAGSGQVPSYFSSRPASFNDNDTMKVIVLMTDGENFTQERHNPTEYRTGQAPIWRSNGDGMLSVYHNRSNTSYDYWVPHRSEWRTAPWNSGSGTTRLNWNQVWAIARTNWVAWQLFARPLGGGSSSLRSDYYNTWRDNFRSYTDVTEMNSRLDQLCEEAKSKGILVYGIAFEAPTNGQTAIQECASSPSSTYFFNAQGSEIQTSFDLIASNLSQLRLTQ
ncbi:MAG: TadE/TadG family type IV pilus assembly protein [Paracoccaceae bacterium]